MAKMISVNCVGLITRRGAEARTDTLVTNEGLRLTSDHPRVPRVGDNTATLMDALLNSGHNPVFKGHGTRWVKNGRGTFFMERVGATEGTILVFGGNTKRDALLPLLPHVASTRAAGGQKPDMYVTFAPGLTDEQAAEIVNVCETLASQSGNGDGFKDMPGFGSRVDMPEVVAAEAAPQDIPQAEKPAKRTKKVGKAKQSEAA